MWAFPPRYNHNTKGVIMKAGTILKKGEQESRTTSVEGDIVTVHHVTKHSPDRNIVCDWKFDFNNITRDQLIRLASRSLVIDARNEFKKLPENDAIAHSEFTYSVVELIAGKKRGKTDEEKVEALMAKMDPEVVKNLAARFIK